MKNQNFQRHQEVSRIQARTKLVNCALLVAYVYGQPGGWYAIADGHIDGFSNDYALVHSNPGDTSAHPIKAFYLDGSESELYDLKEHRQAVKEYHDYDELPLVTTLTKEEITAAVEAVREAAKEAQTEDVEEWVRELCGESVVSDLSFCDWNSVVGAIA